MTVTSVDKDIDRLTLTVVAEFDAAIERVWRMWADPRLLERWWGPVSHPATVDEHDLSVGGAVTYVLSGPDGQTTRGWWRVTNVDPPVSLDFVDGFAEPDGTPITDRSTMTVQVRLARHEGGTRMEVRSVFSSRDDMEQLARMGALDLFVQSVGQMDALLVG
jgi:uncharacterized protein YndB with AHSA1/START domain